MRSLTRTHNCTAQYVIPHRLLPREVEAVVDQRVVFLRTKQSLHSMCSRLTTRHTPHFTANAMLKRLMTCTDRRGVRVDKRQNGGLADTRKQGQLGAKVG